MQQRPAGTKQRLLAALLSAVAPGAGQFILGQRRKGGVLLIAFVGGLVCVWPLRLPRFFALLILVAFVWLGLSLYAVCATLLERSESAPQRPSKWLLLAVPLLAYIGFNLVFTPFFLGAGFRALKFDSSAMETTLLIGDQFISDANYYRYEKVARNDLVVMRRKDYQTVKRVVAIGGDTIEGKNRRIILNGLG